MQMNLPEPLTIESGQAIAFLEKISELLKQQRRHFDDAVVVHCIRLINDYVEENIRENDPPRAHGGGGNRS